MYFYKVIFPTLCIFLIKSPLMRTIVRISANHPHVFGLVNNSGFVIIQADGLFGLYKNIQLSPEIRFSSCAKGVQQAVVMIEDIPSESHFILKSRNLVFSLLVSQSLNRLEFFLQSTTFTLLWSVKKVNMIRQLKWMIRMNEILRYLSFR